MFVKPPPRRHPRRAAVLSALIAVFTAQAPSAQAADPPLPPLDFHPDPVKHREMAHPRPHPLRLALLPGTTGPGGRAMEPAAGRAILRKRSAPPLFRHGRPAALQQYIQPFPASVRTRQATEAPQLQPQSQKRRHPLHLPPQPRPIAASRTVNSPASLGLSAERSLALHACGKPCPRLPIL